MVYQKACEIEHTEKRKKPVIVTEVYDPPLPAETDRGRSGEYIKLLRPLLLSQVAFDGKLCALCNLMGLFDAYIEVLKENPAVQRKLAVIKNENDLDIWQPEFYPKIGERYYASILKGNLRRRIKYALDSLQRQGIIRWKEITHIVPDICTETDEGAEERPEAQSETDERTEAEGGTEVNGSDAVGGDTAVSGDGSAATNGEIAVNGDTAVSGDGADGQVSGATAPGGQAAQSGGPTAQAGTDGAASSGSGTAAAAPSSGSNDSSDGAAAEQTVEEAMKELFGSSLVAYSDSTGQYEVLDTASLAHRASRSGRQTSSPIETALTAARITASPWHGASTAVSIRRSGRALS